jgi:hypothetical protein
MKIHGKKVKPTIKNVYRKTIRAAIVTGLIFSSVVGVPNIVREVSEEIQGDNLIVELDLGTRSYALFNRDERTAMQVFEDAKAAALAVEGLDDAYNNSENWTVKEKQDFIVKFSSAIGDSAGVRLEEVDFVPRESINGSDGVYVGDSNLSYTLNKIVIAEDLFDSADMREIMKVAYHEMIHFIEGFNIQNNNNVDNLDKELFNANFTYGKEKVYRSNFKEISAQLLTSEFMIDLDSKLSKQNNDHVHENIQKTIMAILDEIIENDVYYNNSNDEALKQLKVRELLIIALNNNYKNKNETISEQALEEIYTYEVINRTIPKEFLNISYNDLSMGGLKYRTFDLNQEVKVLEDYIKNFKAGNFDAILSSETETEYLDYRFYYFNVKEVMGEQMFKVMNIIKYGVNPREQEDESYAVDLILDYLDLMPESLVEKYNLNSVKDLSVDPVQLHSQIDEEMTR